MQTGTSRKKERRRLLIPATYSFELFEDAIEERESYTYDDYLKLPEGAPYQLIGGKLVMTPSPSPKHQEVSKKLAFMIVSFAEPAGLGQVYYAPLDVCLSDKDIFQPDIIFVGKEREDIIGKKNIQGAPDIVIEILSPASAYYDLREKFKTYEAGGVKEYWIVDPGIKKIEVYESVNMKFRLLCAAEGEEHVFSKVLNGFSVALHDIFG